MKIRLGVKGKPVHVLTQARARTSRSNFRVRDSTLDLRSWRPNAPTGFSVTQVARLNIPAIRRLMLCLILTTKGSCKRLAGSESKRFPVISLLCSPPYFSCPRPAAPRGRVVRRVINVLGRRYSGTFPDGLSYTPFFLFLLNRSSWPTLSLYFLHKNTYFEGNTGTRLLSIQPRRSCPPSH
jgi:hypothetical protein